MNLSKKSGTKLKTNGAMKSFFYDEIQTNLLTWI